MHVVSYVHLLVLLYRTWTVKNFFWKFEKSLYCFEILFNQTLIKSLGGTKILSFNEVFNSLSLCFVYLVLFYKPFQTFIIVLLVQYRYTVAIQHPVRLIVDWFFRRCIYIYIYIQYGDSKKWTTYLFSYLGWWKIGKLCSQYLTGWSQ